MNTQAPKINRAGASLAKAMFGQRAPVEYTTHKGYKCRVFNEANPYDREDTRATLKGLRVIEIEEGYEWFGVYFDNMVKRDLMRKDARANYYWITKAGAELWGLRESDLCDGVGAKFPE